MSSKTLVKITTIASTIAITSYISYRVYNKEEAEEPTRSVSNN